MRDDVYDLVVKDTREKVGVTNLVGLAERYDALNKELCSSQTQDSLHEEINASLGILHDMHIEEFVVHNITTINTIQGSKQEEYDAIESDDNEDFVVDCELEFDDDDEELQFARRAIRNPRKKISFDVNSSQYVNECEANNQVQSVGQGRNASRFCSHLPIEYEVEMAT